MSMTDDTCRATALLISSVLLRTCLIGFVLLGFSSIIILTFTDRIYAFHSGLIDIPRPQYNALLFDWLGQMKLLLMVFFLLPGIAIRWSLKAVK